MHAEEDVDRLTCRLGGVEQGSSKVARDRQRTAMAWRYLGVICDSAGHVPCCGDAGISRSSNA